MDEIEEHRRGRAVQFHYEARQRAFGEPIITARWTLGAAAAAAVICFNALTGDSLSERMIDTLIWAISGYIFSMSATGAALSYFTSASTQEMIMWEMLDRPATDIASDEERKPAADLAMKHRIRAGRLQGLGTISFMGITIWGAWWFAG